MKIMVIGKNMSISEALEARVQRKVGKLNRYFGDEVEATVKLSVDKARSICEVTIPIKGSLIRAEEESHNNMYAAIDAVCEKLERQVRKNRTRLEKKLKTSAFVPQEPEYFYPDEPLAEEQRGYEVVKEKRFTVEALSPEEAAAQMELLGHTFFLFLNTQTGTVCAVYKRHDGDYGLLIPEY